MAEPIIEFGIKEESDRWEDFMIKCLEGKSRAKGGKETDQADHDDCDRQYREKYPDSL